MGMIKELQRQLTYRRNLVHQAGTERQLELTTEIIDKDFEAFTKVCSQICDNCDINTCPELMVNKGKIGCGVEPNPWRDCNR
jgi:hypothetical protein